MRKKKNFLLTFKKKHAIRFKTMCGNKSVEQVKVFNYLGCMISFDINYDLE